MMIVSMLSIVYYLLQNAIRFLWEDLRIWCVILKKEKNPWFLGKMLESGFPDASGREEG
jgi:hypothetical protein